jgi:hypothetical protein
MLTVAQLAASPPSPQEVSIPERLEPEEVQQVVQPSQSTGSDTPRATPLPSLQDSMISMDVPVAELTSKVLDGAHGCPAFAYSLTD